MKFYILIFSLAIIGCKVTDKTIVGTYKDKWDNKIVLNADHSAKISVDIVDTITKIVSCAKTIDGQWTLINNGTYLKFKVYDENFRYVNEMGYIVAGKKLKGYNMRVLNTFHIFKKIRVN